MYTAVESTHFAGEMPMGGNHQPSLTVAKTQEEGGALLQERTIFTHKKIFRRTLRAKTIFFKYRALGISNNHFKSDTSFCKKKAKQKLTTNKTPNDNARCNR